MDTLLRKLVYLYLVLHTGGFAPRPPPHLATAQTGRSHHSTGVKPQRLDTRATQRLPGQPGSLTFTKEARMARFGTAETADCLKGGVAWLQTRTGQVFAMPTVCKTYACKGCRNRRRSRFKLMVAIGCSMVDRSWLITVTLKPDTGVLHDADFVRKALRRFWYRLKHQNPNLDSPGWLAVPELTERGEPHMHMVVVFPNYTGTKTDLARDVQLAWTMAAREDKKVVSFIADTRGVYSGPGAGAYLGKYMSKSEHQRPALEILGFTRRFSRNHAWPGDQPLRLRGTSEKAWATVSWSLGDYKDAQMYVRALRAAERSVLCERVGGEHYLAAASKAARRAGLEFLHKLERKVTP